MRKITRQYPISSIISFFILAFTASALLCACQKTPASDDGASVTDYLASPENTEPVTDYLAASELANEESISIAMQNGAKPNPFTDLSVPTYLTKVNDTYFLVDCYHNQVIYHDNLAEPLSQWHVMTDEIDKGHTLASDGIVYLIDDTENNRILILEKKDGIFLHTQTFSEIGTRPHYIIYDENTDTFYAWSSMSGEMFLFRHNPGDPRMYLTQIRKIDLLDNIYVRSFTIIEDDIYFVSANGQIIRADLETFEILDTYPVPDTIAGMIQLTKIEDHFYLTISTDINGNQDYATIIRTKKLSDLKDGKYEDIYENFIGGGTPYYITELDNAWYLTEHRIPGHSVWRFHVKDNEIADVQAIY